MEQMKQNELEQVIRDLSKKIDDIYLLVLGGGKESRIVETSRQWYPSQCDSQCDFTEVKVPKKYRAVIGKLRVHPGVKDWADEKGLEDIEDVDPSEIPSDYLRTPVVTNLRTKYMPTQRIQWNVEDLPYLSRAHLGAVAADMGLAEVCRQINPGIDWRSESKEWVLEVVTALAEAKKEGNDLVSVLKKFKFQAESNKEALSSAKKEPTGGTRKKKSTKKVTKKVTKKKSTKKDK